MSSESKAHVFHPHNGDCIYCNLPDRQDDGKPCSGRRAMTTETQEFQSGAKRSKTNGRPDLIPKAVIEAMARRLELGLKYGENNWRKGGEDFRKATIGHILLHIMDYIEHGNRDDANTDAIACNAAFLCHYEEQEPYRGADPGIKISDIVDIKVDLKAVAQPGECNPDLIIAKDSPVYVDTASYPLPVTSVCNDPRDIHKLTKRIETVLGKFDCIPSSDESSIAKAIAEEIFL
jgi:hypothetical protein